MMRRHELDKFLTETQAQATAGLCDGACEQHVGSVLAVRVFGKDGFDWGYFSYCETARNEDAAKGMTLEYPGRDAGERAKQ